MWEKVHAQTGWSLQCCYMPSKDQPDSDNTDSQNPLSATVTPSRSPLSLSPKPSIQNTTVSESDQEANQEPTHANNAAVNTGLQQPLQQQ